MSLNPHNISSLNLRNTNAWNERGRAGEGVKDERRKTEEDQINQRRMERELGVEQDRNELCPKYICAQILSPSASITSNDLMTSTLV